MASVTADSVRTFAQLPDACCTSQMKSLEARRQGKIFFLFVSLLLRNIFAQKLQAWSARHKAGIDTAFAMLSEMACCKVQDTWQLVRPLRAAEEELLSCFADSVACLHPQDGLAQCLSLFPGLARAVAPEVTPEAPAEKQ